MHHYARNDTSRRQQPPGQKSEVKTERTVFLEVVIENQGFIFVWDERAPPSQRFDKLCSPRAGGHLISQRLKVPTGETCGTPTLSDHLVMVGYIEEVEVD